MNVSIVIPSFNTKELTVNCLNSIENDDSSLEKEVIVIDNASNDGTVETLSRIKYKNIKLKLIQNDQNIGFAKACNKGIRRSSGKYILLLNTDTIMHKSALDLMVGFAEKTAKVGIVGARLLNPDGSIQGSCFRLPTVLRAVRQCWLGQKKLLDKYYPKGNLPSQVEAVVGAAFLITPECIKKVGLMDERYFMYFEDMDYCRRVKKRGLGVYYLPEAKVTHYHGASGATDKPIDNEWRRLIPSSIIYHGYIGHMAIYLIMYSKQIWQKIFKK